jgi:protein phosphatase
MLTRYLWEFTIPYLFGANIPLFWDVTSRLWEIEVLACNDIKSMSATQEINITAQPAQPCEWGGATGLGPRKENQDVAMSVAANDPRIATRGVVMVLCDGVGSEYGGQKAARIAAQTALDYYLNSTLAPQTAINEAIKTAQKELKHVAANDPTLVNMATTIVVAVVYGDVLYTGHVGDSRAYIFRANGEIMRITHDHSWVAEQVARGILTEEEAKKSAMRVLVTRSLGSAANNTPEFTQNILQPQDRVLLCSDGLHGTLNDAQVGDILRNQRYAATAAQAVVKAALPTTGDNTTAIVLHYGEVKKKDDDDYLAHGQGNATGRSRKWLWVMVVGGLILALAGLLSLLVWGTNLLGGRNNTPILTTSNTPMLLTSAIPAPTVNEATPPDVNTHIPTLVLPTTVLLITPLPLNATSTLIVPSLDTTPTATASPAPRLTPLATARVNITTTGTITPTKIANINPSLTLTPLAQNETAGTPSPIITPTVVSSLFVIRSVTPTRSRTIPAPPPSPTRRRP